MNNTELSIQINLGGFSFSLRSLLTRAEIYASRVDNYDFSIIERTIYSHPVDRINIYHNTPCATIVPSEIYARDSAENYLKALNLMSVEDIALSVFSSDKAVVWVVDKHLCDAVQATWPGAVWNHPASEILRLAEPCSINILTSDGVAHIGVFDSNGLFALRSTRCQTAEDLLYFVRQIATCDTYNIYQVNLYGDIRLETSDLFKRYYANIHVANDPLFLVRL